MHMHTGVAVGDLFGILLGLVVGIVVVFKSIDICALVGESDCQNI